MSYIIVTGIFVIAMAILIRDLMMAAYANGKADAELKAAAEYAALKERQTRVILTPRSVEDVARSLDDHGF